MDVGVVFVAGTVVAVIVVGVSVAVVGGEVVVAVTLTVVAGEVDGAITLVGSVFAGTDVVGA